VAELQLSGRPASPGLAFGPVVMMAANVVARQASDDPIEEAAALKGALAAAALDVEALMAGAAGDAADILAFQVAMLEDDALSEGAFHAIEAGVPKPLFKTPLLHTAGSGRFYYWPSSDAQRFLHSQYCGGYAGTSSLVSLLIPIERAIHPAVISMELSQSEVSLHDVKRRSRGAEGLFLGRQEIFERLLRGRQRLAARLANRAEVLIPVGWFRKRLENRLRFDESTHVDHVFHARLCRQARGRGRVHVDVCRIVVVDDLQDGKPDRDLNHRTQMSRGDPGERVFQHWG